MGSLNGKSPATSLYWCDNHIELMMAQMLVIMFMMMVVMVPNLAHGVVVDGKSKGPSPLVNQSKPVESIDSFNTASCGLADPETTETGFVNHARHGQFPWIASFQVLDTMGQGVHFCCGSFISDKWILSAAHCFQDKSFRRDYFSKDIFRIVAGTPEVYGRTNKAFFPKKIYIHSEFIPSRPIGFDIALIELEEEAELIDKRPTEFAETSNKPPGEHVPFINSICLPLSGKEYSTGERVRVAGWGNTEYNNSLSSATRLLFTDMELSDTAECVKKYSKSEKLKTVKKHYETYDDLLCADYKAKRDTCQGDSGSALIEYADGKAIAVGIVSYGLACASPKAPGVYTKVSTYLPWIQEITTKQEEAKTDFIVLRPRFDGDGLYQDEDD